MKARTPTVVVEFGPSSRLTPCGEACYTVCMDPETGEETLIACSFCGYCHDQDYCMVDEQDYWKPEAD